VPRRPAACTMHLFLSKTDSEESDYSFAHTRRPSPLHRWMSKPELLPPSSFVGAALIRGSPDNHRCTLCGTCPLHSGCSFRICGADLVRSCTPYNRPRTLVGTPPNCSQCIPLLRLLVGDVSRHLRSPDNRLMISWRICRLNIRRRSLLRACAAMSRSRHRKCR
jgi:hypothetical protein